MTSTITMKEDVAPAAPTSGYARIYAKTDGQFYYKGDDGVEHALAGSDGAAGATGATGASGRDFSGDLAFSEAGNALTISVKIGGIDPSAGSPVIIRFRSVTASDGSVVERTLDTALSLVISSGSTLGASSGAPFRIWIVAFDDAGTLRLGVINCLSGTDIYPLGGWGIASSTAEGGAGAADSPQVFYTGTAVTSKAYQVLGYAEFTLTTAGTWDSNQTRAQVFGTSVPLPGQVVQERSNSTGEVATGTTIIPLDDTIPQNTEGDQYLSQAITPSSAANVLETVAQVHLAHTVSVIGNISLFQDTTANALASSITTMAAPRPTVIALRHRKVFGATASTTLKIRAGGHGAGTTTFNGSASARQYGGALNSFIIVKEIMA